MKKIWLGIGALSLCNFLVYADVSVASSTQEKMKLHIALLGDEQKHREFLDILHKDLACDVQKKSGFDVSLETLTSSPSKKYIKQWADKQIPLLVFLSYDARNDAFEWRMYSTARATMKVSGRVTRDGMSYGQWGHVLAENLWQALTNQPGVFMSKLVYCRRVHKDRDNNYLLQIGSPFEVGSHQDRVLVKRGALMAPRWNNSSEQPVVLYSEATQENVRLVSVGMDGKRSLVSNFDGLNMLPSFAPDGSKVIYCLSRDGSSQLYSYELDATTGKRQLYRLTHNDGNNVSPILLDNGDIVFCSDFQKKTPQICYYHADTKEIERITDDGCCTAPAYCPVNKQIAYIKVVAGVMQVCTYDCQTREHRQITFDQGDKDECSWSPCGNYLAYSVETQQTSRIAIKNCVTGEQFFKTSVNDYCIFPCWSGRLTTDVCA